jgi:hypothetical protein
VKARVDKAGRLQPPESLGEARSRLEQLQHELYRIDKQLSDPERQQRAASPGAYASWRAGCRRAQQYLTQEHDQLVSWISEREQAPDAAAVLLRRAYDLLVIIRDDGGLDGPEEEAVVRDLARHLEAG